MTDIRDGAPRALRAGAFGVGAITFLVVSAAGPLITIAAGLPVGTLLGNGAGMPGLFVVAILLSDGGAAGHCGD